jgi:M6 family metalloprotease-like protein
MLAICLLLNTSYAEVLCWRDVGQPLRAGKVAVDTRGNISALVIFTKFKGEAEGEDAAPSWAGDLFNANRPGSFTHFYNEMSRGQLTVQGEVLPRRYSSLQAAAAYTATAAGTLGKFGEFNLEILEQADRDVDLGRFDNDGPDGVPNSGDDDGYVDVVFINLLTVPRDFFIGSATGFASLGLDTDYISDDGAADGGFIRIPSRFTGFGGTTQRGHVFTVTAGTMCHEFGHVLGLPDLFDQSAVTASGEIEPEMDSAGIGKWGLMGLGTLGWGVEDGPNAFCAWSLAQLGWIGTDNENLVEVEESLRDVVIEDIDQGGKVYKIALSQDEYFLLANRQTAGSFYDRNIPGEGLLVWHVDERADNDEERHKQVDLVCADGLFADRGFPGGVADPVNGGDNLDFFARDSAYAGSHNGNQGDATDPFDGVRFTRFAYDSNPATNAHAGFARRVPLGFAVENIRADGGRMMVDILLRQPLAGHIATDTTWSGTVLVDGDITVEPGARLTLAAATEVRFGRGDSRGTGFNEERSELLVYGELEVQGSVRLVSGETPQRANDWLGIFLLNGQASMDGLEVAHAQYGVVRTRLPAGTTRFAGVQRIPLDLLVPATARMVVEAGAELRFSSIDLSGNGIRPMLTELIVAGELVVEGEAGRAASFELDSSARDEIWYGVRLVSPGRVEARFLQIEQCGFGFSGEVENGTLFSLADSRVQRALGGLNLLVNGRVEVDRTNFMFIIGQGIAAQGSGHVVLRGTTAENNGLDGVFLGNCSMQAIDVRLEGNGSLDEEDPRSGLVAVGGRGQKIELWNSTLAGNSQYGLELSQWEGTVELHGSEISGNKQGGLVAAGLERLVFEDAQVVRNLGVGAALEETLVEVWSTVFEDNLRQGLVLGAGSSGAIEMSRFANNDGLRLENVGALTVRGSRFENAILGFESQSSAPRIQGNLFVNNSTALRLSGTAVPLEISGNVFARNRLAALENLSSLSLNAVDNYWGTTDSTEIAALIKGEVEWAPFLNQEPGATAVVEVSSGKPARFALHPGFPNPFNAAVTIRFDLPEAAAVGLVIYDMLGQKVRRLQEGVLEPGYYRQSWDGRDAQGRSVASGVYLFRLKAGEFVQVGRLVLLR